MNNLKYFRKLFNLSQDELAEKLGVKGSAVSKYECNRVPLPQDIIGKLCTIFGCSADDLLGINQLVHKIDNVSIVSTDTYKIPILNTVRAGVPTLINEDNIIDYEELTCDYKFKGELFGLRIKGNSMYPQMIENDLIIVKRTNDIDSGEIGVVLVNGDEATVKKVVKSTSGITLVPFNSEYNVISFTNDEILSKPVQVVGKVIEVRRKY